MQLLILLLQAIRWTATIFHETNPGYPEDCLNSHQDGVASLAKLAINSQKTAGHSSLYFDEMGNYIKTFEISSEGQANEGSATLTQVYDNSGLRREFVKTEFSVDISRCLWCMFVLAQPKIIKDCLSKHIASGFANRNIFAQCYQNPDMIHVKRMHFSSTTWTAIEDLLFHIVFTNIITSACADNIKFKLSSKDYHLVFETTATTEAPLFLYDLIVMIYIIFIILFYYIFVFIIFTVDIMVSIFIE